MSIGNRQKAAALVLALGSEKAGALLQHLSEEEIKALADEVAELDEVAPETRDGVYRETLQNTHPSALQGGVERARELLATYHGNAGNVLIEDGKPGKFSFLRQMGATAIAQLLEDDHPQTIALVISDMDTETAAEIVLSLPEDLRTEVSFRLATIGVVSTDVLQMLSASLHERLNGSESSGNEPPNGAKSVAEILNSGTKEDEQTILGFIGGQNPELAEKIRALMFVFEDIVDIDDRGIQGILKNLDTKTLAMSLKGTTEAVKDTITRNLSERAKAALLEEIDLMGPVRRSEVEEAQAECVAQIRMLEESGEIILTRGGSDDLVT